MVEYTKRFSYITSSGKSLSEFFITFVSSFEFEEQEPTALAQPTSPMILEILFF